MTLTARRRFALVVGVLALAACLRLWRIAELPPGLYNDEAFFLLRGQEIARGQSFPTYIIGDNGNEPLYSYLCAIALLILGPVTWAGRLIAAWAGLIGVAFVIRVGDALFPRQGVGILAGLVLAAFLWNLTLSRLGNLPILTATAGAGTLAVLWHGVRTGRRRGYALAGLCLGLGLISYPPFRLFPLVVLCAGVLLLLARPKEWRSLVAGGVLMAGVTLVIYAPLGLFFIQHPYWFFNRFGQTTVGTLGTENPEAILWDNAYRTLSGLVWHGDENWRQNIAGRPALDAAQFILFLIGAWTCFRQWRKPEVGTLFVWLVVGLAPSVVTMEAPHFGRTTMVTPAIALMIALGIGAAWQWSVGQASRGLIVAAVALSAILSVRDYFGRWASDDNLFQAFDGDQVWSAQALRTAPAGARLFATPFDGDLWTVEYLLGPDAFRRFRGFNGRACLVVPSQGDAPATYAVVVAQDSRTLPALQAMFPEGARLAFRTRDGQPYLDLYQIPAGQLPHVAVGTPRQADFGGLVRMLGYTLEAQEAKPGGALRLRVTWQAEQATQAAYKVFVHLIGPPKADGDIIYTQRDVEPCEASYPTWQWSPGELILDSYTLFLPEDLPPGNYVLQAGWYDGGVGGTGERLSVFDQGGQPSGDVVKLEQIHINAP